MILDLSSWCMELMYKLLFCNIEFSLPIEKIGHSAPSGEGEVIWYLTSKWTKIFLFADTPSVSLETTK